MPPTLDDVVHVPPVAAALAVFLPPKDVVGLIVWALEKDFHDGVRYLVASTSSGVLDVENGDKAEAHSRPLLCAAAFGCRNAFSRLVCCGGLTQFVALTPPLQPVDWRDVQKPRIAVPASCLYEAARRGDQATVDWLAGMTDAYAPHKAMEIAASSGHVRLALRIGERARRERESDQYAIQLRSLVVDGDVSALAWTVQYESRRRERAFRSYFATAKYGLARVQRCGLWDDGNAANLGAMNVAASHGDLALLKAMHEDANGESEWTCTPSTMDDAAAHGHLPVLQWLAENRSEGCTRLAMDEAARHGHVAVVKWLHDERNMVLTVATLLAALEGGHVEMLVWLHGHTPTELWTKVASRTCLVEAACESPNRLRVLQWLEAAHDIRLTTKAAMSVVLGNGDVKTAQWLADPMDDGKNLEHWNWVVAKWMSYEFALWHNGTLAKAAVRGHADVVKWLARAGPFHKVDLDTLYKCGERGYLEVVEFILQNPLHQPQELAFLPRAWSSFCDVFKSAADATTRHHAKRCKWYRFACDPPWARPYVELWLQYRPMDCKRVPWLSQWALHCGYTEIYELLTS